MARENSIRNSLQSLHGSASTQWEAEGGQVDTNSRRVVEASVTGLGLILSLETNKVLHIFAQDFSWALISLSPNKSAII